MPSNPRPERPFPPRPRQQPEDDAPYIDLEPVQPGARRPPSEDLSGAIAWLLDGMVHIPGTPIRIGLDPILGLLPGVGDGLSAAMGSLILIEAVRLRVPRVIIARMGVNLLLNAGIGSIPILGDLFSIGFRSNAYNHALLKKHAPRPGSAPRPPGLIDWLIVGAFAAASLATIGAVAALLYTLGKATWNFIAE